jgi:hypothetical protein
VPAPVIVTETMSDGSTVTLYSRDVPTPKADAADASYTGELVRIAGIGGESTGYGLRLDDGRILELELAEAGFTDDFVAGRTAEVVGVVRSVEGVEVSGRQVLVVNSFRLVD